VLLQKATVFWHDAVIQRGDAIFLVGLYLSDSTGSLGAGSDETIIFSDAAEVFACYLVTAFLLLVIYAFRLIEIVEASNLPDFGAWPTLVQDPLGISSVCHNIAIYRTT